MAHVSHLQLEYSDSNVQCVLVLLLFSLIQNSCHLGQQHDLQGFDQQFLWEHDIQIRLII
jgi:hypothetical protein